MGDYAGYARDLFRAIGIMYWLLCAFGLLLALWLPKGVLSKVIAVAVVVGLASILPFKAKQENVVQQTKVDEFKQRYDKAKALFDERCKSAGEKIYRTVEGVEGLLLLKKRDSDYAANEANPLWADAALPREPKGDWYIISFLGWEQSQNGNPGVVNIVPTNFPGYRFVDVAGADNKVQRYALAQNESSASGWSKLVQIPQDNRKAKYAVDFVNPINAEDRKHWVAETIITITEIASGEMLAERRSFAFEPGLGSNAGQRQPWGFAVGCPRMEPDTTQRFVKRVLKIKLDK